MGTAEEVEEETGESGSSKGGYSADCSASDQSSSDDGPQKPRHRRDSNKTIDTTAPPKLPSPRKQESVAPGPNENAVEPNIPTAMATTSSSTNHTVAKESALPLYAFDFNSSFFPQWNGVSISNPLDPRIDFSNVSVRQQQATVFDAAARMLPQQFVPTRTAASVPNVQQPSASQQQNGRQEEPEQSFSVEQYTQLLEAVRPFFFTQAGLPPMMQQQQTPSGVATQEDPTPSARDPPTPKDGGSSSTGPSSEGFTAFFTTTDASGQNNSNNDENNNNSKAGSSETSDSNRQQNNDADTTASMEVLARPRHKKQQQQQQDDRRVRIHEGEVAGDDPGSTRTRRVVTDSTRTTSGSGGGSNPGSSTSLNDLGSTDERKTESKPEEPQVGARPEAVHRNMVWDKTPAATQADVRERKMLDKKRKRIEMRREYEAQQQFESSESSDPRVGEFFKPGKPLALDQAIVFSSIPRIIIHSSPPFLVVHSNAAFCRLTGIDSHVVEGKPVSSLLSVKPGEIPDLPHVHQHYHPAAVEDADNFRLSPGTDLERLLVTCGYGHLRVVQVQTQAPTKPVRMLGRNVIIKGSGDVAAGGKKDEESNNSTSLSSTTVEVHDTTNNNKGAKNTDKILCKVSIAPIISTINSGGLHGADGQATMKRLRQSSGTDQYVSHFVIQFEPKAGGDSGASISSASLAVRNSSNAANVLQMHHHHNGSTSESSQALAAVA